MPKVRGLDFCFSPDANYGHTSLPGQSSDLVNGEELCLICFALMNLSCMVDESQVHQQTLPMPGSVLLPILPVQETET